MSLTEDYKELNKQLSAGHPTKGRIRGSVPAVAQECCESKPNGEEEKFAEGYVQWASSNGLIFRPASQTRPCLPPGAYEVRSNPEIGLFFEKIKVKTEGLIRFPDTNSNLVVDEIQKFWTRHDKFLEYGLSYKRGILLYGPAGAGKSCTIQLIMEDVVARDGIVINFRNPGLFIAGMRVLRQIQSDTPVVATMEDIDAILETYSESEVLNVLDGMYDVDRMVFLATTNYPERLGARIVNRPSRFDKRFRIGYPSAEARCIYLEHLIGKRSPKELGINLDKWVKDTDEFSIAHLRELFIAVVILEDKYSQAVETLRSMKEAIEDREDGDAIGFKPMKKSLTDNSQIGRDARWVDDPDDEG
jgi:hypothetical protein